MFSTEPRNVFPKRSAIMYICIITMISIFKGDFGILFEEYKAFERFERLLQRKLEALYF